MKSRTTGLNVRFFNVTIATGHGRTGNLIGNACKEKRSAWKRRTELGRVVIKVPVASKLIRR